MDKELTELTEEHELDFSSEMGMERMQDKA